MNSKIIFFCILIIGVIFVSICWVANAQSPEKVSITTDKTVYKSRINKDDPHFQYIEVEPVEITVINNSEKDIYFGVGFIIPFTSLYFEIYKDGDWQVYNEMLGVAEYPGDFTFKKWLEGANRVKANEKITFKEKPVIYRSDIDIFKGKYRLRLEYYPNCSPQPSGADSTDYAIFRSENEANCFGRTYSNEFIIE